MKTNAEALAQEMLDDWAGTHLWRRTDPYWRSEFRKRANAVIQSRWFHDRIEEVERTSLRKEHCGCAWCCSVMSPERRGEKHLRVCKPKTFEHVVSLTTGDDDE